MLVIAVHGQTSRTVDGKILTAEQRRVKIGVTVSHSIAFSVRKRVHAARVKSDKYLVSRTDIKRRSAWICQRQTAKHELYLVFFPGAYGKRGIGGTAGNNICPRARYRYAFTVSCRTVAGDAAPGVRKNYFYSISRAVSVVRITV